MLRIKTYVPPWEAIEGTLDDVLEHAAQRHLASVAAPGPTPRRARDALPRVEVVTELDVSRDAMRRLYSAADAFVLPTRGEGWGLPVVEASGGGGRAADGEQGPTHHPSRAPLVRRWLWSCPWS